MGKIDYTIEDDSQLLRLIAQGQNDIVDRLDILNNSVAKNSKRIAVIDTILEIHNEDIRELQKNKVKNALNNCTSKTTSGIGIAIKINWQMIAVLIVLCGGLIFTIVKLLGG